MAGGMEDSRARNLAEGEELPRGPQVPHIVNNSTIAHALRVRITRGLRTRGLRPNRQLREVVLRVGCRSEAGVPRDHQGRPATAKGSFGAE
jgi:hypothetical protein